MIIKQLDRNIHVGEYASSRLAGGDISTIVDNSLSGKFDHNSAWKVVELALACLSHSSSDRPTMTDVVSELKECLGMKIARNVNRGGNGFRDSGRVVSVNVDSEFSLTAR